MKGPDEIVVNRYDYKNIPLVIADRLGLIPIEVANACITNMYSDILNTIDPIERIAKQHRHKTVMGLYTEKPAWI